MLREDEAGQGAVDPDVNERGERQREPNWHSADETSDEAQEHWQTCTRCARSDEAPTVRCASQRQSKDDGDGDVGQFSAAEQGKREYRHAERACAHGIKG